MRSPLLLLCPGRPRAPSGAVCPPFRSVGFRWSPMDAIALTILPARSPPAPPTVAYGRAASGSRRERLGLQAVEPGGIAGDHEVPLCLWNAFKIALDDALRIRQHGGRMRKVRGPHDAVDTEFVPMLKTALVADEGQIHLAVEVATRFVVERRKVYGPLAILSSWSR